MNYNGYIYRIGNIMNQTLPHFLHKLRMSELFSVHGLCEKFPKISGIVCESGSTDLLICAKVPLAPWMKIRPSAVLLGVERIEGNEELARKTCLN